MEKLRVLIVDDDSFTRVTLASTLRALGCTVVGDADSAPTALRAARKTGPEVAVLDLDLGEGPTGIDLALALRREFPAIGIVMLSAYEDPRLMGHNQPALPAGAVYLVKRSIADPEVLGRALRLAGPAVDSGLAALSDQQVEIMRLVALGCSNAEIARRRSLNEPSVEKAIARLIKHFDLKAGKDQNQRVMITQLYFQLAGTVSVRQD